MFQKKREKVWQRPPAEVRDLNRYPRVAGDDIATFSDDRKQQEFVRCAVDPAYFIKNYCMVQHPTHGLVPFMLYPYQENKVLPAFRYERYVITRKFRQGGFSTVGAALNLWSLLFENDQEILVISKSDREAMNYMNIAQEAYKYLPEFLRCKVLTKNKHEFEMETGSKLLCYTPEAGVSYSCSLIVIDEAAHIKNMPEKWRNIFPVISTGGRCWIISTCNGVAGTGEFYYKRWIAAEARLSDFFPLDVEHTEHPDYNNPEWEEQQRKELGELGYRQNVLREFIGVDGGIFKPELLIALEKSADEEPPKRVTPCPKIPKEKIKGQRNWTVWEEPQPGVTYIIAGDIAEGHGMNDPESDKADNYDYSVIQVLRMDNLDQVAEYRNDAIAPTDFAEVLYSVAKIYNDGWVVLEAGPLGQAVLAQLIGPLQYESIYSTNYRKLGLQVDKNSRPLIYTGAIDIISKRWAKVRSRNTISELRTIVMKSGRIDHLSGYHDDGFTALAYGYYCREAILAGLPPEADMGNMKSIYSYNANDLAEMFNRLADGQQISGLLTASTDVANLPPPMLQEVSSHQRPNDSFLKSWGV